MLHNLVELGLLQVSGSGAKKLLQGQLTCDLNEITTDSHRLAAICNPQGRVISLFFIVEFDQSYLLLMPRNLLSITKNALKKYAIFFKAELEDVSNEFYIYGQCSDEISLPIINNTVIINIKDTFKRKIIISKENIQAYLTVNKNYHEWKYFNILTKLPTIYAETSNKFLPHEINLQHLNAISFTKGCYTGQEIISRMHYRGKLKKQLQIANHQLAANDLPLAGQSIFVINQDQSTYECGSIVDVYQISPLKVYLLIMIENEHIKNNHLIINTDHKNNFLEIDNYENIIANNEFNHNS